MKFVGGTPEALQTLVWLVEPIPFVNVIVGRGKETVQVAATPLIVMGAESATPAVQVPSYMATPPSPKQPDNTDTKSDATASSRNKAILDFIARAPWLFDPR